MRHKRGNKIDDIYLMSVINTLSVCIIYFWLGKKNSFQRWKRYYGKTGSKPQSSVSTVFFSLLISNTSDCSLTLDRDQLTIESGLLKFFKLPLCSKRHFLLTCVCKIVGWEGELIHPVQKKKSMDSIHSIYTVGIVLFNLFDICTISWVAPL